MIEKLGLQRLTGAELVQENDRRMRPQYVHLIENFPDKMDEFLREMTRVNPTKNRIWLMITIFLVI